MDHLIREAAGTPQGALVLLHGRGADEHDLFGLFDVFDPQRRLTGVTIGAPLTNVPPGGRHWYVVPRVGFPDPTTFFSAHEMLDEFLGGLPEQIGVAWDRTVIGGFSQGGVMSYALGLGKGRPSPAGILAMSCFMPTVPGFEMDLSDRQGFPVAIAHGSLDPVISVEFAHEARDRLTAAGADVLYRETPMGHTIDPRVIPDLSAWLTRTLPG
jgi:phospholipase/carboxylesterase